MSLPTRKLFNAMKHLDEDQLLDLDNEQLHSVLAGLVRVFILSDRLLGSENIGTRSLWNRMHEFSETNSIISLFRKVDFDNIAQSVRSLGLDWISLHFTSVTGNSDVVEFEMCQNDSQRRLGLVLQSLVAMKTYFDSNFNQVQSAIQPELELFNCSAHWTSILNHIHVILLELGEFFDVLDVAESMLILSSDPVTPPFGDQSCTYGAWMAWWLLSAYPDRVEQLLYRILNWKPIHQTESQLSIQRLTTNRMSFILNYEKIFGRNSRIVQLCLGKATLSNAVLTIASQHLSTVLASESPISMNHAKLNQALFTLWNVLLSSSTCFSGSKRMPLISKLQWVAKHEQNAPEDLALMKVIRSDLLEILNRCSEEWNATNEPPNANILSSSVRLLAAFQLSFGMTRLTENEISKISGLFRVDFSHAEAHIEAVCELVCLSCASPELSTNDTFSNCLQNWMNLWRASRRADSDSLSGIGELIIQIALHCYASSGIANIQTQCQLSLSTLLSARLKLANVTINSHQMALLKRVFLSVLPESTLATSVLLMPANALDTLTSGIIADFEAGYGKTLLAATCVLMLLRSPAFVKHQLYLQLKDWLLSQLKSGHLTLDPTFHLLLQNQSSAGASLWSIQAQAQPVNPLACLIQAEELSACVDDSCKSLFGENADSLSESEVVHEVKKLLGILFYALTSLEHYILSSRSGNNLENSIRDITGLTQLIERIPVKVIIYQMESVHVNTYSKIYPALVRLLLLYFPHICSIGDCLHLHIDAKDNGYRFKKSVLKKSSSINEVAEKCDIILKESSLKRPRHSVYLISKLHEFIALDGRVNFSTICCFAAAFSKAATVFTTREIGQATRQLLGPLPPGLSSSSSLLAGDQSLHLIVEPLTFLTNLDKRMFQNPVMLKLALSLYSRLLAANRQFFSHRIIIQAVANSGQQLTAPLPPGVLVPLENSDSEAAVALDLLQQCESVTYLLEICASIDTTSPANVEVRSAICTFIHQLFLHSHQLVKLVHFQTYPLEAIPVAVALIPSIHVCLDFIPEMLTTTAPNRQIFSVCLLSYIAAMYPVPRAFALAKLAIDVIDTTVTTMTSDKRVEYFGKKSLILDSIKRLATLFPPLVEDVVHLLIRVNGMTVVQKSSSLVLASPWSRNLPKCNSEESQSLRLRLKETLIEIVRKTKLCKVFLV